jgi:hypothetical protein
MESRETAPCEVDQTKFRGPRVQGAEGSRLESDKQIHSPVLTSIASKKKWLNGFCLQPEFTHRFLEVCRET